jgi:membrane protein YdbS with pleckstrin-like domain
MPSENASINHISYDSLSKHYPKLNAFSHFIGWAVILVILLIVHFIFKPIFFPLIIFSSLFILSALSGLYGYYFAKSCGYFKSEFDILFKQGLWWKKQTALSFSRIQHIDISHGPLERKYGLATIKFFTAGGATSDLKIPGLPKEIAEAMRKNILEYAKNEELDQTESPDQNKNLDQNDV